MSAFPARRKLRLPNYDYSAAGTYYITICTQNRAPTFWQTTEDLHSVDMIVLSDIGKLVDDAIQNLTNIYPTVCVDHYAVMADHIHLLITLQDGASAVPSIATIMSQFKGSVSRQIGKSIWQRGYNDHIIRNENDYLEKWKYIDENPLKYILKSE